MWGPLQAAQLDGNAQAQLSQLWDAQGGAGAWSGGLPASQLPLGLQQGPEALASPQPGWPGQGEPSSTHSIAAKVYVQGLPQNLQHPVAVASLFSPYGDVLDVKLYAAEVRLSGGSAVVRMRNGAQSAAAIAALNGIVPDGGWQQLTVRAAETAEQRSSRISAINGRQQSGAPGSPLHALPPAGPGGASAAAAALRRVHSARGAGSSGALQCYTAGLSSDALAAALPLQLTQRRSMDWPGSGASLDSSRRSSLDVTMRCGSTLGNSSAGTLPCGGGRTSSDSGSGSGSEELASAGGSAASLGDAGNGAGNGGGAGNGSELQRMLLEAVLALLGQVETGQLSLPAMRLALEAALVAAKQQASPGLPPPAPPTPAAGPAGGEEQSAADGIAA